MEGEKYESLIAKIQYFYDQTCFKLDSIEDGLLGSPHLQDDTTCKVTIAEYKNILQEYKELFKEFIHQEEI